MRYILLFVFIFLTGTITRSQNLIGYNDKDIRKYMKDNCSNMNLSNVKNDKFNYLKYTDNSDSQTILFFLNQDFICNSVRMICDMSIRTEKVRELNSEYTKEGEYRWTDKKNGDEYLIELKDEQWSCVITIIQK